jgi:CubicO group peptidase (beta-lactamase class C family)
MSYLLATFIIVPIVAGFIFPKLKKLYTVATFFSESNIVNNFKSIPTLGWPYSTASCGQIAPFEKYLGYPLPSSFKFDDKVYDLNEWIKTKWVTGIVVLHIESPTNADLVHESYFRGNNAQTQTISWSLNKSVVSALIGIAISEGKIKSVDDYVTTYVPKLEGSGYDGVTIKNVLTMSSGVSFSEDYADTFSDINMMGYWLALGYNIDDFISTLSSNKKQGTQHNYISADTQVLGMVLKSATNQPLTSYLEEKLWKKAGFESNCHWLLDNDKSKTELAFGTLITTTRDYARFGWLYANGGLSPVDGTRLIDEEWIKDSVSPHFNPQYPKHFGYGYQWWLPRSTENYGKTSIDYMAIGVYGQYIYVNPERKIVIAMNSANPDYSKTENITEFQECLSELQAIEALREIAKHYSPLESDKNVEQKLIPLW